MLICVGVGVEEAASVLSVHCESHQVSILADFQVDGDTEDDATTNL